MELAADRAMSSLGQSAGVRTAGSLPFPDRPVGTADEQMPFDHIVVVMMENHSFENLLGDLGRTRTDVQALTFQNGKATNWNPGSGTVPARVSSFPLTSTAQATNITQSWRASHEQINGGAMDGFVKSSGAIEPMGYYTPEVLPFAYSLASTFTLADHWFCSAPAPTYPNRRFLLAGTARGLTVTNPLALFDGPPPNGTILDQLSHHQISWANYSTELPMTLVFPGTVLKHLAHHHAIERFFHDCQAGALPAVSFVDPALGKLRSIASALPTALKDALSLLGVRIEHLPHGESEEDPDDMYYGEAWAHEIVEAVLRSPAWPRTLLIYTYDEHGGYYDHLAPPAAPVPDELEPRLSAGDPPGRYDTYGPRVPAIVVSPYCKPGGVSHTVCDHTSVLATIEHKWNLPALTARDANANTVMDFLDTAKPAMLDPPRLKAPSTTGPSGPVASSD
jgi:phospholipase C